MRKRVQGRSKDWIRRQATLKTQGRQDKKNKPVPPEITTKLVRLFTEEKLPMSVLKTRFSGIGMVRIRKILVEAGVDLREKREHPEGIGIF